MTPSIDFDSLGQYPHYRETSGFEPSVGASVGTSAAEALAVASCDEDTWRHTDLTMNPERALGFRRSNLAILVGLRASGIQGLPTTPTFQ